MLALPGFGVLVEVRAVEVDKPVRITREVRWYPVENDPHAAPVEMVHEGHEVPRAAEATRGCEIADGLIAPRAVERMLHDGQELDVGETHRTDVVRELLGELAVVEEAVALLGDTAPRAKMHFVDRERFPEHAGPGARGEPGLVAPPELVEIGHD